jgi:acyl-homoserine lactone acylase PvdQ
MKRLLFLLLLPASVWSQPFSQQEISKWKEQAKTITITRDKWGIAHISGKTDADAVFGMLYAQCEDDFNRVEKNYITATARQAEAEGENFIYHDLRQRLYLDTLQAIAIFNESPQWMKRICYAFADGINYYLSTHPQTKPKLIKRFQPWMPLLFSEGSIGGDLEAISLAELESFYTKRASTIKEEVTDDGNEPEPRGSNGFVIAPSKSASGNALLLINPHTSFYFRSEIHVTSEEGLNAYGAVTWGQFFIYQGFNSGCGWMHPTSRADAIDEYEETISQKDNQYFYKYGSETREVKSEKISITYKKGDQKLKKEFTVYKTHHAPVVAERNGKWICTKIMVEPLKALTQSYQRTKAKNYDEFKKVMELRTNSSNNTLFADANGTIAYWHGDFIPKRNPNFNWEAPVDGSNPETEWKGLHELNEIIQLKNPASGWIQNCNQTPFTSSGASSPDKTKYPTYMAPDTENARGLHAVKVLAQENKFTLDKLIAAAYDPWLPGMERLLPSLLKGYDEVASTTDSLKSLSGPIQTLKAWDYKWSNESVATLLSIYWAQHLRQLMIGRMSPKLSQLEMIDYVKNEASNKEKVKALQNAVSEITRDFGKWQVGWGEVNRFQRLTGNIEGVYDDNKPSLAVPFTSSLWGSLAAYGSKKYPNTKKMYGNVGNSFVAVVEFGKRIKAKSVVTGGPSGDPTSPHFNDESSLYAQGKFKDVLFYKEDIARHTERSYHPGE